MQGDQVDDDAPATANENVNNGNTESSNGSDINGNISHPINMGAQDLKTGTYPGVTFDDLIYTVIEYNSRLDKAHVVKERKPQRISLVCSAGTHNCSFRAYAVRLKPTSNDENNTMTGIRITQFAKHTCQGGPKRKRQLVVRRRKVYVVDNNSNVANKKKEIFIEAEKNKGSNNNFHCFRVLQSPSIVSRIPVPPAAVSTSISTLPVGSPSSPSPPSGVIFPFPDEVPPTVTTPPSANAPIVAKISPIPTSRIPIPPVVAKIEADPIPAIPAIPTTSSGDVTPLKKKLKRAPYTPSRIPILASYPHLQPHANHSQSLQTPQKNMQHQQTGRSPISISKSNSTVISPSTSSIYHVSRTVPVVPTPIVSSLSVSLRVQRENNASVNHHLQQSNIPAPALRQVSPPSNHPAPERNVNNGMRAAQPPQPTGAALAPRSPRSNGAVFSAPVPVLSHVMYVAVPVLWTGRALAFWQDVVGLRVIGDGTVESGITLGVGAGATRIYLYTVKQLPHDNANNIVLTLGCPDVHAAVRALRGRGTHIVTEPERLEADPRVIQATFRDSEGNTIGLQGLAQPHPN